MKELNDWFFDIICKLFTISEIILGCFHNFIVEVLFIISANDNIAQMIHLQNVFNQFELLSQFIEVLISELSQSSQIFLSSHQFLDKFPFDKSTVFQNIMCWLVVKCQKWKRILWNSRKLFTSLQSLNRSLMHEL